MDPNMGIEKQEKLVSLRMTFPKTSGDMDQRQGMCSRLNCDHRLTTVPVAPGDQWLCA